MANKIPVDRTTVVKWENGKRTPDVSSIKRLTEIFDITFDELLVGELNTKREVIYEIYEENVKYKRIVNVLFYSILFFLLLILFQYFFNQYKSTVLYTFSMEGNNIIVENGLLIKTNNKLIFNVGDVSVKDGSEVKKLELIYSNNGDEDILYYVDDNKFIFHDYIDYNEYIDFTKFNTIIDNLYLKVYYNDTQEVLKIDLIKDYLNDEIILKKHNSINSNIYNYNKIDSKILEKFKKVAKIKDDKYFYTIKRKDYSYIINYYISSNILSIELKNKEDKIEEIFTYDIELDSINYSYYLNPDNEKSYNCINNACNCLVGNCESFEKINNKFFQIMSELK